MPNERLVVTGIRVVRHTAHSLEPAEGVHDVA